MLNRGLNIVGMIAIGIGFVWVLQGVGILPGSFMSGQPRWAVIGAVTAAVGALVVVRARRRR